MHRYVSVRPVAVLLTVAACGPRAQGVASGGGSAGSSGGATATGASSSGAEASGSGGSSGTAGGTGSVTTAGGDAGVTGGPDCVPAGGWINVVARATYSWGEKDDGHQYWWGRHPNGTANSPQKQEGPFRWRSMHFGAGGDATAVEVDGSLWTWSWAEPTPKRIGTWSSWKQITLAHMLTEDGFVYRWPWTGYPEADPPAQAAVALDGWLSVEGNSVSACGLRAGGEVWCWGSNQYGQLGDGTLEDRAEPVPAASSEVFVQVSYGSMHACAVSEAGTLWCWGDNAYGEAGLGFDAGPYPVPTQVGSKTDWVWVGAGGMHSCALDASGTAWCWGRADYGALGIPGQGDAYEPVALPSGPWSVLSVGGTHNCAVHVDTTAWCWGSNDSAAIGDGQPGDWPRFEPTQVCG